MVLKELTHHVRPTRGWQETGVFDGWAREKLKPDFHEIEQRVIPRLLEAKDENGKLIYPWLKNRSMRRKFVKYWLESYQSFLDGNIEEIPDFDRVTGIPNQGHLCEGCQNWETRCKILVYKAPFNPFDL